MKYIVKGFRKFLLYSSATILPFMASNFSIAKQANRDVAVNTATPNIIMIMADDLGYGDTGFTGHSIIQTPHLDAMANDGLMMTNFHAGAPVCSPTRGTFVTGRHFFRYGIFNANRGHLPKQEITLSEALKEKGYTTGHFGKWHLGTLSKTMSSKGAKRNPAVNYSPPAWHGYDKSFVTESAVTLWDPGVGKRAKNNPFWLDGVALDGADPSLLGSASRVVMDRAIPFIEQAVESKQPFFTMIWFHAPHADIAAGPKSHKYYTDQGVSEKAAHYYGVVTEMDKEVGRLRTKLKKLGIADNTLITFTSDNGPEGRRGIRGVFAGETDGLRGRKGSIYEGGVRVPTLALWPGVIQAGSKTDVAGSTLDYFPTITDLVNYQLPDQRPIDGESLLPLLTAEQPNKYQRKKEIITRYRDIMTLIDGDFKFVTNIATLKGLSGRTHETELYNLKEDRAESNNISQQYPEKIKAYQAMLVNANQSFYDSHQGKDYHDPDFKVVGKWQADIDHKAEKMKAKSKKKSKKTSKSSSNKNNN